MKWNELLNWARNSARTYRELQVCAIGLGLGGGGSQVQMLKKIEDYIEKQEDQDAKASWQPQGWRRPRPKKAAKVASKPAPTPAPKAKPASPKKASPAKPTASAPQPASKSAPVPAPTPKKTSTKTGCGWRIVGAIGGFLGIALLLIILAVVLMVAFRPTKAREVTVMQTVVATQIVEKKVEVPVTVVPPTARPDPAEVGLEERVDEVEVVVEKAICRPDKVGTFAEVAGAGDQRMEISGESTQHVDYYPQTGVLAVSYIIPAIEPSETPDSWCGYGSIWQGNEPSCATFDWISDTISYAEARLDSGHSGLVIDLRGGAPKVVGNVGGMDDDAIDALLSVHAQGQACAEAEVPAPVSCEATRGEDHAPTPGEPWVLTVEGPSVVHFWTNWPEEDQTEYKVWLDAGTYVFHGGGSVWTWPSECWDAAETAWHDDPLPEVSQEWLREVGLLE